MQFNPLSNNFLKYVGSSDKSPGKRPQQQLQQTSNRVKKQKEEPERPEDSEKMESKQQAIKTSFSLEETEAFSHLILTQEAYLFAFLTKFGQISGRSIVLFPQGIIANCSIANKKIHGWIIIWRKNVFASICSFKKGIFQGPQFTHDISKGLMIESFYKNGKLSSIVRCLADKGTSFQKFINNKILIDLLKETQEGKFFQKNYPKVESPQGKYYGQKNYQMPHGLGVLIAHPEIFYGQFDRGLLSGKGVMTFDNGSYYAGQFANGITRGLGLVSKYGQEAYRYNDISITQQQFKCNIGISQYSQLKELSVFSPIISFYHKLKSMYQEKAPQSAENDKEKEISVVDINIANDQSALEKEETDRVTYKDSLSSPPPDLKQNFYGNAQVYNDFLKINKTVPKLVEEQKKNEQPQVVKKIQRTKLKKEEKKESEQLEESKKKAGGKGKRVILSDLEWEEVIEQLEVQESVGREDSFLRPRSQKLVKNSEQVTLKSNHLTTQASRQNIVRLGKYEKVPSQVEEKELSKIIARLKPSRE